MTPEEALAAVESMTHDEMARLWRFGSSADPRVQPPAGDRLRERLAEAGGITPSQSKRMGW